MTKEPSPGLTDGDVAPPVTFQTVDGYERTMENYEERTGTAVTFLSARCETTAERIEAINTIYERHMLDDVLFVGIVSNQEEAESEVRRFVQHEGIRFPVYRDPDGEVARTYGATVTPEVFLLDGDATLRYRGSVGLQGDAEERTLEDAIAGMLEGGRVPDSETSPGGTPINDPGGERIIPDPYGTLSFRSELVFEDVPGAVAHHCSTVTEAPNGDVLCLWYGGSYESSEDQALYMARLPGGDGQWERPDRVVWNPGQPPGNAVVFTGPGGDVWIVWGRMEGNRPTRRGSGWGECRLLYRRSEDSGHEWSEDVEIPGSFGWLPRNGPLELDDGTFALPVHGDVDGDHGSFFMVLDEVTESWSRQGFIPGTGSQPTVVQRDDGDLLCFLRNQPSILESVSTDRGHTWSDPEPTDLNCPGSGIDMTRLENGRTLLVHNDSQDSRSPLTINQSVDGGRTWEDSRTLEADPGRYSYPSIIQASDGTVHVTYTYRRYSIKHVAFNEDWLTHVNRPN